MKQLNLFILFYFILFILTSMNTFAGQTTPSTADLTIHITGFETSAGIAKMALINSKENYTEETPFKGYDFKITNNEVIETIPLPYGEYAIKVFHDENKNNELDTMVFGIPAERYGFSNDARGMFGPPEYDAAVFKLDAPKKEISITIK